MAQFQLPLLLTLLRSILRRAVFEWEWFSSVPRVRLLKEPIRRVRYLTALQAQKLLNELPVHLAAMAAFSLATGLRKSNVTGLQWEQVDISRGMAWVHPDQSKSRRAIPVPLNDDAMRILALQTGRHPRLVFALKGEAIAQVNTTAWKKALKRAGIDDFRWHDLRHTWASWHVQNGTPVKCVPRIGRMGEPANGEKVCPLFRSSLSWLRRSVAFPSFFILSTYLFFNSCQMLYNHVRTHGRNPHSHSFIGN